MRAAIYNPYLDTLGGGERYTMAVANVLSKMGYIVDVGWTGADVKRKLEQRFGLKLKEINFIDNINRGDGYDVCFWVSDGSIPLLRARVNLLHFQFPFTNVKGKTLLNRMKLQRIKTVVCNSKFTKSFIDKEYGVGSEVVYPPVDINNFKPKRKKNIILSVGRFSQLTQAKRQDVLVRAFKKIFDSGYKDWELILAGGVEVGVDDYVEDLEKSAKGYPIRIIKSPSFKEVVNLYGISKIFWSAAGFGVNEKLNPKKVEHFGITVVEAMSAGCIPVVYKAGGHKEIVQDGKSGYLWDNTTSLLRLTKKVIINKDIAKMILSNANERSNLYTNDIFEEQIKKVITK